MPWRVRYVLVHRKFPRWLGFMGTTVPSQSSQRSWLSHLTICGMNTVPTLRLSAMANRFTASMMICGSVPALTAERKRLAAGDLGVPPSRLGYACQASSNSFEYLFL